MLYLLEIKIHVMPRKLTQAHLDAYKRGGDLFTIFNCIKNDSELSFEIRINDEVFIYFNKKKILSIKKGNTIEPLSSGYYKDCSGPSIDIRNRVHWTKKKDIESYFREAKFLAYRKQRKQEFELQQNYSLGNRDCNGRFIVVDMEWQFSQKGMEEKLKVTRPDLVVVDLQPNVNNELDIYLAEVKLGTGALNKKSGLQDHVYSTQEIIGSTFACNSLREDVMSIIKQKHELGILTGSLPDLTLLATKPKMMFILGHRGKKERNIIEATMSKLDIPHEIREPKVIYHDTLIKL